MCYCYRQSVTSTVDSSNSTYNKNERNTARILDSTCKRSSVSSSHSKRTEVQNAFDTSVSTTHVKQDASLPLHCTDTVHGNANEVLSSQKEASVCRLIN